MIRSLLFFAFISLIPASSFSQVKVSNGTVSSEGEIILEDNSIVSQSANWKLSKDKSQVTCELLDQDDETLSTLSWNVENIHQNEGEPIYEVVSSKGELFMLTFVIESNTVIILNLQTNGYSAMNGLGVDFKKIAQ